LLSAVIVGGPTEGPAFPEILLRQNWSIVLSPPSSPFAQTNHSYLTLKNMHMRSFINFAYSSS